MVIYGEQEQQLPLTEDTESIKLVKNSKGVYQFEIKVKDSELSLATIERLDKLTKQMEELYG